MSETRTSGEAVLERNRGRIDALRVPAAFREDFSRMIQDSVGGVWKRPGLSPAQRSLATIAMQVARVQSEDLRAHVEMGLENGLSPREIGELVMHCAVYASFPAAVRAFEVVSEVFEERGIEGDQ